MLPQDGGGVLWRAAIASKGLLAREAEGLGLFLLPNGRPGRRFTGTEEEKTTMEAFLGLFLLPLMGLCKLKVQINNGPKGSVKER
jgi:hypothetical protein